MHSLTRAALAMALVLPLASCYTMTHQVGDGGTGQSETSKRQWFILWGLVGLNDVDSHELAAGATDYTIQTEQSAIDVLINLFTAAVTVYSREITVTK